MEKIVAPRIIISGLTQEVGKSLFTIGLLTELRRRGVSVACCVIGSNFKQAALLRGLSERYVHTLDPRIQSSGQILESLHLASLGAEIVLIEGEDTVVQSGTNGEGYSEAADTYVARVTHSPILPVIDWRIQPEINARALAELARLINDVKFLPAVANRLPESQADVITAMKVLNEAFAKYNQPPVLGTIPELSHTESLPAYGASQSRRSEPLTRTYLMELGLILARCVDIDEILRLSKKSPTILLEDYTFSPLQRRCRIAVSLDNAFGLCYQDNLTFLKNAGAEIVRFSPLADTHLPKEIGGLYLTGGFLDEYGPDLARNDSIIKSIQKFHDDGGAIYSEGAGTAYLSREFLAQKRKFAGVGIYKMGCSVGNQKVWNFHSDLLEDSIMGEKGLEVSGLQNGDWQFYNAESVMKCLRVNLPEGGTVLDGYSPSAQVFGTFAFLHWGTNSLIARNFVESSSVIKFQP
jgi:cobyrinic acid a,c-diamide synthase